MNDEVGLLIDAFDEPPFIRMTYNPPIMPVYRRIRSAEDPDLYAYAMFESENFRRSCATSPFCS